MAPRLFIFAATWGLDVGYREVPSQGSGGSKGRSTCIIIFLMSSSSSSSGSSNKSTSDTTFTQGKARRDLAAPQLSQTLPLFQTIGIFVNTSGVINLVLSISTKSTRNLIWTFKLIITLIMMAGQGGRRPPLIADPLISSSTIIATTSGISCNKYFYWK